MRKLSFLRSTSFWPWCALVLSALATGLVLANPTATPLPAPLAVQTPKANFPIQTLPTAHASPIVVRGSQEQHGLAWLDNRRVLFFGALPGKEIETRGLFIWDVVSNTVSQYSSHVRFCYADGYIVAFGASPPQTDPARPALVPVRYGQIGKEKDDICDIKTRKGCPPPAENMSCKPWDYAVDAQPLGPAWGTRFELRSGDGLLLAARESKEGRHHNPELLLNKHFPKGFPLPFAGIPINGVTYSEFEHRYVFTPWQPADGEKSRSSNWPEGRPQPVYLLSPKGEVDTIQVPWRAEWDTVLLSMPTKAGLVFKGGGGYPHQWGGLFLYDGREVWDLDRGRMETLAVSPDGCRVAYAINNDYGKTRNVRFNSIKSINFCGEGK